MSTRSILVLALALLAASLSRADVTVGISPSTQGEILQLEEVAGKWRVIVRALPDGNVTFTIKGDTTDPIEYILVEGDNPGYWSKFVVDGATNLYDIPSIERFGYSSGHGFGKVWITGLYTSGDAGTIQASRADIIHVLGDVTGTTFIDNVDPTDVLGYMFVGGDVLADIDSPFIEHLQVVGDIGPSVPCSIYACGYIRRLEANSINGALNVIPGIGCFGILGTVTLVGDFTGTIGCNQVGGGDPNEGLFVGGNVNGSLNLYNAYDGSVRVRIGGSFDGTMELNTTYPFKQIVINANNATGAWNGDITIGGYTLGPAQSQPDRAPYYNRLSSEIGGGAVGLAPFHLHDKDCIPENGTTQAFLQTTTIRLRHYGPVQWDAGDPVVVFWGTAATNTWYPLDEFYWVAFAGSDPRDIIVTATTPEDFDPVYDYKIVPSATLQCTDVTGNPAVDQWVYYLYAQ